MNRLTRAIVIASIVVVTMLIVPIVTTVTVAGEAGMAVTLLLFFVVHPAVSIAIGALAGRDIRFFWPTPLVLAGLFWVFACVTYEPAFPVVYSLSYMGICAVSMLIAWLTYRKAK